ncbi:MAG: UDP-N-acetylmuramoyl-tripeptide--D-alanyl-D-alanine ligase [Candidatus Abyssobacteria bacterium SURF_5]|uniref:UDP-N-acetylmuramoyl-tripeptide--D-alanyl-D-alanine ligase n=1 Tax=Abyssobacteria bacterium (strain SURF_5) TaxID=2093360 RepID=A0A3A4PA32_ABYX5|nr:MAG: UDP-N-acetylmuramoyl-tripeptide--D-alanyl-D-alanine ligase [Candidatus Abyssubacteria bacterium SURF_5]
MKTMSLEEMTDLCGGRLIAGASSSPVSGLSTDTRTIQPGEVFLALKGERFDGHAFAEKALEKGAAAVIAERGQLREMQERLPDDGGLIEVGDTLAALHLLAQRYRAMFHIPVIGITGSCGKTTTKDMLSAILNEGGKALKTEGNLNNLIGAPLMLLKLAPEIKAAVIEIASNSPGEIARLSSILNPTGGIITSVGPVHLEGFGSLEGVMNEKCSLAGFIAPDGFLVINHDDIPVERIGSGFKGKITTFGAADSADFYATAVRQDLKNGAEFLVNGREPMTVPVAGLHNILNALAATAAARELGIDFEQIRCGLRRFAGCKMRMEILDLRGITAVNDAYNANPRAMRESISTVMAMPAARRILVLGDMLELGDYAREAHRSLGLFVGQLGPDLLYLMGSFADEVRAGAVDAGLQANRISCFARPEEIATSLREILQPQDLLLVKGSRGMRMERVLHLLNEEG